MTEVQEHLGGLKPAPFSPPSAQKIGIINKPSRVAAPTPTTGVSMQLTNALIRLGATARDKTDAIRQVAALLAENGKV